jgi:ATP-dependent DNA helicase RecG
MAISKPTTRLHTSDPVQFAKGLGPVRAEVLKEVGVETVEDLLYYFPRRYLDRRNVSRITDLKIGQEATVLAKVVGQGMKYTRRRKFYQVTIADESGSIVCIWFNGIEWIQKRFHTGDRVAVHGKVEYYRQHQLVHPDFDLLEDEEDPLNTGRIVPLYPGTAALKSRGLDTLSWYGSLEIQRPGQPSFPSGNPRVLGQA